MKLKAADCPKCGAPVSELNIGKRAFKCDACGMTLVDEDIVEERDNGGYVYRNSLSTRAVWDNMYVSSIGMMSYATMSVNPPSGLSETTELTSGETMGYGLSGRLK